MSEYKPLDFHATELEVAQAISTLKRNGFNIQLPEHVAEKLKATVLFDGDDALFKELVKNTQTYFEYGCGKSTEFVYKYSDADIYAVDTSIDWVRKVRALQINSNPKRLNIDWINVGNVREWGYPVSFMHRNNFKAYAECFWKKHVQPELVLIDGRFRVLCFLTSLKFAQVGTKILFDDYIDRPFYHLVEEFCPRLDVCGRQVLFEVTSKAKSKITDKLLLSFQNVID